MDKERNALLNAIYEQLEGEGFPIPEQERPNMWEITEKAGSFEGRLARFLTFWLNPNRNSKLGTQPLEELFQMAASKSANWNLGSNIAFQHIRDEDVSGTDRIDASIWFESAAVFLEIKMSAREGKNQRARYAETYTRKAAELGISEDRLGFLYLTKYGQQDTAQYPWININYGDLLPILENSLEKLNRESDKSNSRSIQALKIYLEDFYTMLSGQIDRKAKSITNRFLKSSPKLLETVVKCVAFIDKDIDKLQIDTTLEKFKCPSIWSSSGYDSDIIEFESLWRELSTAFAIPNGVLEHRTSTALESMIRSIWILAYNSPGGKVHPYVELAYSGNFTEGKKIGEPKSERPEALGMKWVNENLNGAVFDLYDKEKLIFGIQRRDIEWTAIVLGRSDGDCRRKVHFEFREEWVNIRLEPYSDKNEDYSLTLNQKIFEAASEELAHFGVKPQEKLRMRIQLSYDQLEDHGDVLFKVLQKVCML
ncbi:PD-(D/E)XK nuclease family protein [Glutamicibacter arilaitensis]|uniref:PD-(D/E)XK nuclease family protein n=1 Tax=Glutamicibacter arilaitensis TaxID=256701 RepID=UPI003F94686A